MIDVGFPIIEYSEHQTPREWGRGHGEAWREAIRELVAIRRGLLQEKDARFTEDAIRSLAETQWKATVDYDVGLAEELEGIAEGAAAPIDDLVVLNNYTDFRDLEIPDQGCSTIYVHRNGHRLAGQTWDMHGSAKRFLCVLKIPALENQPESVVLSLVGCVGMMGYSRRGSMVGVNNINTDRARPGVLWPVVIRKLVHAASLAEQREVLRSAPLTSGRCFLLADHEGAELWEAMPELAECVSSLSGQASGQLFHTNHCVGNRSQDREIVSARPSTTEVRYRLLERKMGSVVDLQSGWDLLNDHEGYPQSICSHFQSMSIDPSFTCGGAMGDLNTGQIRMWRGDKMYDENFIEHELDLFGAR